MKICLVSAFPPSRRGLNEYGFHIARELQQDSLCSLIILADQLDEPNDQTELDNFDVQRIWRFNSVLTPVRLIQAVRRFKPDVLLFQGLEFSRRQLKFTFHATLDELHKPGQIALPRLLLNLCNHALNAIHFLVSRFLQPSAQGSL